MKVIIQRDLIRTIVEQWEGEFPPARYSDPECYHFRVLAELKKLDLETVPAEVINRITGTDRWTTLYCEECRSRVPDIVQVGQGSCSELRKGLHISHFYICFECLRKAFALIQ